jgi:hypothetical protein
MSHAWRSDHTSPTHEGIYLDAAQYRGEVVEPGRWSCCGASRGGPGCKRPPAQASSATPRPLDGECGTPAWRADHLSPKHSGFWVDEERYRGEVVEPASWSCCGSEDFGGECVQRKTRSS